MKIFHLTSWLSNAGGGIPPVVEAIARELQRGNHSCSVLGLRDRSAESVIHGGLVDGGCGAVVGPSLFGYSPELRRVLGRQVTKGSVIHVHGLWMYPGLLARHLARKQGAALVMSPHGMLDPWALRNSRWKKWLAGWAYENRNLREANCLHALCAPEAAAIRAYGLKNPVCVIPNGMEMPEVNAETLKAERLQYERKTLLFLGRLHPKKGLVNALRAWAKIRSQGAGVKNQDDWQFVIAGWDQGGHEADLKRLCTELALAYADVPAADFVADDRLADLSPPSSVVFTGPAFGADKAALLQRASAFILPSFSEGLPMSVLEAWSYGLPVLMTDHCNLPDGFAANAALRIGTDVESIAAGLQALLSLPCPSLVAMGDAGRTLVERQFTWPRIAAQMKEVYEWVLGGGSKPECVME
jgi:poly(glycerol-phosphate) alpha-glucosyltransferase